MRRGTRSPRSGSRRSSSRGLRRPPRPKKRGGDMRSWIIGLAAAGVVIAIVLGLLGRSDTVAEADLCTSVGYLQSDIAALKNTDVSTVSKGSVQSTIDSIQADWTAIKGD